MNKQEKLAQQKEEEVAMALKVSESDVLEAIKEGSIQKALKKVVKDKAIKKPSNKAPNSKADKGSLIYKDAIYKGLIAKDKKSLRQKLRKTRNKLIKQIISLKGAKLKADRAAATTLFIKFYKANYKLNDLSIQSLSAKQKDKDTDLMIKEFLQILKRDKVSC